MTVTSLFEQYGVLTAAADLAFREMRSQYPSCVRCEPLCADCCHAVFGLFLIEAAYLRFQFEKLPRKERRQTASRAAKAEKEMERLINEAKKGEGQQQGSYPLEKARVRCPLLNDLNECVLYQHRPLTCRVYGIPTAIHGKAHICWKAEFEKKKAYPAFNLDEVNRKLYHLSGEFLREAGGSDPSKATFLVSVSKVIGTRTPDLIQEIFL
jgi:Fe-S-cluster containining protein